MKIHLRSLAAVAALFLLVVAAPTASAAAGPVVTPNAISLGRNAAKATLSSCKSSPVISKRQAEFTGRMRAQSGAAKMQMRFTLQQRNSGRKHFKKVVAPGLGEWEESNVEGATVFIHRTLIQGIETSALYRSKIAFRWLDADGNTVASTKRTTATCRQKSKLPELKIKRIDAFAKIDGSGGYLYYVIAENAGGSEAANVGVSLAINGVPTGSQTIALLANKATAVAIFDGPVCMGQLAATIDPAGAIREGNETNNQTVKVCQP